MKKFLIIPILLLFTACAQLQTLEMVATASVTPTQALIAANSFDAAESGATAYLVYCKTNLSTSACNAANRRAVIKYTRAGRAARNQVETYIQTSASIPSAVYNSLVVAVTNLKSTPAANYVGAQ